MVGVLWIFKCVVEIRDNQLNIKIIYKERKVCTIVTFEILLCSTVVRCDNEILIGLLEPCSLFRSKREREREREVWWCHG